MYPFYITVANETQDVGGTHARSASPRPPSHGRTPSPRNQRAPPARPPDLLRPRLPERDAAASVARLPGTGPGPTELGADLRRGARYRGRGHMDRGRGNGLVRVGDARDPPGRITPSHARRRDLRSRGR